MSETVPDILKQAKKWQVTMKFNHGLLLQSNAQALFIGDETISYGPFHIILNNSDFSKLSSVNIGASFLFEQKQIFYKQGSISITQANFYSVKLADLEDPAFLISALTEALEAEITGFAISVQTIIAHGIKSVTPEKLANFIVEGKEAAAHFLLSLVGSGQGLTPAGDDFLIGLYAALAKNKLLFEILQQILLTEEQTTIVSYSYYKAAFLGNFDSRLRQIFLAASNYDGDLLQEHIKVVKSYGSSSGTDLLTGLLFGLLTQKYITNLIGILK